MWFYYFPKVFISMQLYILSKCNMESCTGICKIAKNMSMNLGSSM